MPEIITPGAYCSFEEYRAAPGISKSSLDLIHRSPAHYKQEMDNPTPPTPAMQFGSMFHCLVLTPDQFGDTYATMPRMDRRTTAGKEEYAAWLAENEGKEPITDDWMAQAIGMRDAIMAHPIAANIFHSGHPEQSIYWRQESSSHGPVVCKSRFDWISDKGYVVDLKTCADAREDEFSRAVWRFRYHVQAAYYLDAFQSEFGREAEGYLMIACEKDPPYGLRVYQADDTLVQQGRGEYHVDLNTYAECLESDNWPGYEQCITGLLLPRWAREGEYLY